MRDGVQIVQTVGFQYALGAMEGADVVTRGCIYAPPEWSSFQALPSRCRGRPARRPVCGSAGLSEPCVPIYGPANLSQNSE
jgi:hypothetical protein